VKGFLSLAAAFLLLCALAACGSTEPKSTSVVAPGPTTQTRTAPATTYPGAQMNDHGVKNVAGLSSVQVELDDYYFAPTIIKASPGQRLTLRLANHGTVEHNFTLPGLGISRDVPPKETASVQLIVPRSGTRVFYCKYHKARGMAGELRVRQPAFLG
jgi:plastocyanin